MTVSVAQANELKINKYLLINQCQQSQTRWPNQQQVMNNQIFRYCFRQSQFKFPCDVFQILWMYELIAWNHLNLRGIKMSSGLRSWMWKHAKEGKKKEKKDEERHFRNLGIWGYQQLRLHWLLFRSTSSCRI